MTARPAVKSHGGMLAHLPVLVEVMTGRKLDPMHWHDYTQIWYVLRGTLRHTIGDVLHVQKAGECAVVLPYTPHTIDARGCEDDSYILSISYPDSFLSERGSDIFSYSKEYARFCGFRIPEYTVLEDERRERADTLAEAMVGEFSKHREMSFDKIATQLSDFLKNLCTEPAGEVRNLDIIAERAGAITDIILYMSENLSKKLPLDYLCSHACMSRCAFTKNFKTVTGMTSNEFLLSARLLRASSLLVFTDKTLSEIAKDIGFYDSAHLVRAFTKKFGRSPSIYRETTRPSALVHDKDFRDRWAWFFDADEEYIPGFDRQSYLK